MRVFVTGGTGYVGSGLLPALLEQGHEVTCLVRRTGSRLPPALSHPSVRVVAGELLKPETYREALTECDAVIHLVGIIREAPGRGVTFDNVHVRGTKALIGACVEAQFGEKGKRFVHMSALGAKPGASTGYFRTKWEAEELLRASGLPYVIFRPSVIFGPGDEFVNMLAELVKLPITPVIGSGRYRLQPVSLRTVADVLAKALVHERVNTAWDVGGPEQLAYNDLLREIGSAMHRSVRLLHQPLWLMRPVIHTMERFPFFPITSTQLAMLLEENICREGTPFYEAYETAPIRFADGIREYIKP